MTDPGGEGLAPRLAADRDRLLARFTEAARRLRHRDDPAAAHDVRVALRHLGATLDLWQPLLPGRTRRRAARALRRLRRALGPAAEARTNSDLLAERVAALDPLDRGLACELAASARRRLDRTVARAMALCGKRRVRRLRRLFAAAWRVSRCGRGPTASWQAVARGRVGRRRDRALAALRQGMAEGTPAALHAARVAVKRWRYAIERQGVVVPITEGPTRDWLKALQRTLGRYADLHVFGSFLQRRSRDDAPPAGPAATRRPAGEMLKAIAAECAECVEELRRLVAAREITSGGADGPAHGHEEDPASDRA